MSGKIKIVRSKIEQEDRLKTMIFGLPTLQKRAKFWSISKKKENILTVKVAPWRVGVRQELGPLRL